MNRIATLALVILCIAAFSACAEKDGVGSGWITQEPDQNSVDDPSTHIDQSLLTPEGDGTFSMAPTATTVPTATSIPKPTPSPAPTSTPEPTWEDIHHDDVLAALHLYLSAYHTRSQSALDEVSTAATASEERNSVKSMQNDSGLIRGWSDYPDIEFVELRNLKCDEILCKIDFDGISIPPADSEWEPFEMIAEYFFRKVDGTWLWDNTHETWNDGWDSTHRP